MPWRYSNRDPYVSTVTAWAALASTGGAEAMSVSVPGNIEGPISHTGTTAGFYGHTPVARSAAWTVTYALTSRVLPSTTSGAVSTAAALNVGALFAYASAAQAEAIPVAINAVREDLEATKKVLAQLVKDLQGNGLMQ